LNITTALTALGAALALGLAAAGLAAGLLYAYWRLRWGPPASGTITVLAYHKVDSRFELGGTWTTPGQFARQMRWLRDGGYGTVTLSRAAELMAAGNPDRGKLACLTFDDAYQGLHRHAFPVLRENGFSATVFVVTGYVGRDNEWDLNWGGRRFRHLDWGEMRQMREAGIEFGSHGVSHRDLRRLSDRELESELYDSKRSLEDKLGAEVSAFCYPFGRYDRRVRQAVIDAGYRSACSHSPGMPNSQVDVFALRRCGVYITDILWDFRNKVDQGSRGFWVQDLWSRTVNYCAGGTAVIQRLGRLRRRQ
jgi:peptidoglycan/xylan/chitin deacetylase (PgdA/CDA1 family)